jgi:molecular chaperone DnaK
MQSLIPYFLISAMSEFKDQLEAAEKEKVSKLVGELRELAAKGQASDASISADTIREKIAETQSASLGLFQKVSGLLPVEFRLTLTPFKVYEKRAAENSAPASEQSTPESEPPKEEKKD